MYFDYVIVGAGICGITLAERIVTEMKRSVLLIEKRNCIGGKCFDYYDENGNLKGKYGLHVFYTDLQHVWNYVNCFAKWDTMEQYSSLCKYIGIPIEGYTKMFKNMLGKKVKILLNTDYKEAIKDIKYNKLIYTGELDYYFDYKFKIIDYDSYTSFNRYKSYYELTKDEKGVTFLGGLTEYKYFTMDRSIDCTLKLFYKEIFPVDNNCL